MWKFKERLLDVFEKLFGLPSAAELFERRDVLERTSLECMKLMEMHALDDRADVKHRTDKIVANLDYVGKYYSPQVIFAIPTARSFKDLVGQLGANGVRRLEEDYGTPKKFIEAIRVRMLTEAKNEEPKYKRWFDIHGIQVSNSEFIMFMRTLALRFSGQLSEVDCDDYWDNSTRTQVIKSQISFVRTKAISLDNMKKLVREVLSGYSGIDFKLK